MNTHGQKQQQKGKAACRGKLQGGACSLSLLFFEAL
jgi:hypothetical protein